MSALPDFATEILAPIRARVSYRDSMAEKLASTIADLLNEHEPLLKAEADGDVICVSEKGGSLVFAVTIDPQSTRETRAAEQAAGHES
jgi:hypothetical protein